MLLQVKVPVCVFAFDCLFVDGDTLLKEPLEVRRARMAAALPNMQPGFVCMAFSHRLQARKPNSNNAQPDSAPGKGRSSKAPNGPSLESLHASSAGDASAAKQSGQPVEVELARPANGISEAEAVTDLVSDDEGARMDVDAAANPVLVSTLEKQAPGPEDIATAEGQPVTIR